MNQIRVYIFIESISANDYFPQQTMEAREGQTLKYF